MYEAALIVLGVLIAQLPDWYRRKRRLRTHWSALRAEMQQCSEKAKTVFGSDRLVKSPLYRLPLTAFSVSFPVLLADGAIEEDESLILGRFYSQAQEINRGLDNAAEMLKLDDEEKLSNEFRRNRLKAEGLVEPKNGEKSLYDQALAVVEKKLAQKWWRRAGETLTRRLDRVEREGK